ncbi:MAG: HPP family protein [Planctomycetes bacterium]|nr:HPP family protein [Planctomycetota bacterium]
MTTTNPDPGSGGGGGAAGSGSVVGSATGGTGAAAVTPATSRLRLAWWLARYPEPRVRAAFFFLSGFLTLATLAAIAHFAKLPFLFPSLGPTAILFFSTPNLPAASPRNALLGHAVGILCGYGALLATGLADAPPAYQSGVDGPRVFAAALSLAATGALQLLLGVPHPPAGATTLIISLGVVRQPVHLLVMQASLSLLALEAIALNRLAGIDFPMWRRRP